MKIFKLLGLLLITMTASNAMLFSDINLKEIVKEYEHLTSFDEDCINQFELARVRKVGYEKIIDLMAHQKEGLWIVYLINTYGIAGAKEILNSKMLEDLYRMRWNVKIVLVPKLKN